MRRLALLLALLATGPEPAAAAAAPPPDCAQVTPAALADAFEQWAQIGRLFTDGAGVCLERLRATLGETVGNDLRQARRLVSTGNIDAALTLATASAQRPDLSAADHAEADVTLAELLLWRNRLAEVRQRLAADPGMVAGRYTRLRFLVARARLEGWSRDIAACGEAAAAASAYVDSHFESAPHARATVLLAQGYCRRLAGDHGAAQAAFRQARDLELALGEHANHRLAGQALESIAQSYRISGDDARAERGYTQALAYVRAHPDPVPAQLGSLLVSMANFDRGSSQRARIELALTRYSEAVTLLEPMYGADSLTVSGILNNQANALAKLGRHDAAAAMYERALTIALARGADTDPSTLEDPISNIARIRLWQRRYGDAEAGFRRGLGLVEKQAAGAEYGPLFARLGLAASLWGQQRYVEAFAQAEQAERDRQLALALALSNMSETAAIRYQEELSPALDLVVAIAHASGDAALVARAWSLTMAARGQVSASSAARLAHARASSDPNVRRRFDEWNRRNIELAQSRLADAADPAALIAAEEAFDQAARALALALPGAGDQVARAEIDPKSLQAALRSLDANLVGFVSSSLRGPDEYARSDRAPRPRDVYAFVATARAAPRLLRLADEKTVAAVVAGWREAAGDPRSSAAQVQRAGLRARRLVFDPLAVASDGILLQVPYGDLHQLNLAALPDGDGHLIERGLRVHTLNHERELLRDPLPAAADLRVLAVSDPSAPVVDAGIEPAQADACAAPAWRALPGSRREVAALDRLLPDSARLTDLHGMAASKANVLAALPGQDIIHLATHGLRRDRDCTPSTALASRGVALAPKAEAAAANEAGVGVLMLSADAVGTGYLSEADIAGLPLADARWVVLSACDSGLGDSRAYEGAFGLRRAFQLAGARSVIMSLWRVDDAATADWMAALYAARFEQAATTVDAVAYAQRTLLAARRAAGQSVHPYYWAGFIAAGDWR